MPHYGANLYRVLPGNLLPAIFITYLNARDLQKSKPYITLARVASIWLVAIRLVRDFFRQLCAVTNRLKYLSELIPFKCQSQCFCGIWAWCVIIQITVTSS